ncbi:MAG: hypothetical protein D6692_04040 [Planctomycetota bacterium]|nr:MAG: hypothetical protein D6692_04040 [Planctomycetota bacterium]
MSDETTADRDVLMTLLERQRRKINAIVDLLIGPCSQGQLSDRESEVLRRLLCLRGDIHFTAAGRCEEEA